MTKEQEHKLQKSIDILKIEIQEFLQNYDILLDINGSVITTWKNTSPRMFFDIKRLRQECQEMYLKYTNYKKQSRIFLIK